jgi:microcystin degradation protein MlrC
MVARVAAAQIAHETNVFSTAKTDFAAFEAAGLVVGDAVLPAMRGTQTEFDGFVAGAAQHGFDLIPIMAVWATPSGMVTREAIERLAALYADGLRRALAAGPLDGVLLALHGSMVTEIDDDGEGYLLQLTRDLIGPSVPIVATLDLHANISQRMVDLADILVGYDTYPHIDQVERAREACDLLDRLIRREIHPTPVLRKPPMLPTSQRMTTDRLPMRSLMERASEFEQNPRVLTVTIAGGFPPADVVDAGLSVLVTTDGDAALAAQMADALAAEAWAQRDGFLGGVASFADAAAHIRATVTGELPGSGPIVLVDIADNPWTGGPGDSAELVRFFFAERIRHAAVALVKDPDVAQAALAAGPGATLELLLGGKTDHRHGDPLPVRAYVRSLTDGRYVNEGPMLTGSAVDLGLTALLICQPPDDDTAPGVEVIVTSRAETPIDPNIFRSHGIDPTRRRVLGLKGKGHFRAAFEPIARRVILVEGPGITGSDLSRLDFKKIRRPIWPLDPL